MTGMSLWAMTEQYRALQHLSSDDELDETALEAIKNTLEGMEGALQEKAVNVAGFMLNLEAWSAAAADAGKKLKVRADRIQRRADVLREYIRTQMKAADMTKVESVELTLTRKANPPAVLIKPDAEIPETFLQPEDPMIDRIIRDVQALGPTIDEGEPYMHTMMVTPAELRDILTCILPPRAPDKKKIGDVLKAATKAHEALVKVAQATEQPAPTFVNPVPGCELVQGERLEIKA